MPVSNNVSEYGKFVPSVLEKPVVLKSPKLSGLNYPIPTDPEKGYFSKNSNLSLIKSNLKSLVKTERGERFMRPDYGCDLRRFLMEPLDEITFSLIKEEVVNAISRYLRTVSIGKIQVFETKTGELKVNLICSLKDSIATSFNIGVRV